MRRPKRRSKNGVYPNKEENILENFRFLKFSYYLFLIDRILKIKEILKT
jgi:hypothetical protein